MGRKGYRHGHGAARPATMPANEQCYPDAHEKWQARPLSNATGAIVPQQHTRKPGPDLDRYHRQMLLSDFGPEAQQALLQSTAVLLGCGALGAAAAETLARAGVGNLVIIDRDFVELSNLQRQVLFDEQDAAQSLPKAEAARRRLARINSQVAVTAVVDDINHTNIEQLTAGADVLIDGLDNFETRYLANDCAVRHGIPYLYGGAVGTSGMAFTILPHTRDGTAKWETSSGGNQATPCFRCLFSEAPPPGENPTCDTVGVLGPAVTIVAGFQAVEALKILTGNLDRLSRDLLTVDLWDNQVMHLKVSQAREDGDCPCCKHRDFEFLEGRAGSSASALCGRDAVQLRHRQHRGQINLDEIAARLRPHGPVVANEFMIRADIRDGGSAFELTLFADGRAIVKGTAEPRVARSVYAKYVGS
jgi:molybdopterin/thiamine biosynthesis adenylyltransferase